jgi:Rieske Fe-S protein
MSPPSRRNILHGAVVTGVATVAPSWSALLSGCGNPVKAAPFVNLAVDDSATSPTFGQIELSPDRYPDLAPVGGAITVEPYPLPERSRPFEVPAAVLLIHRAAAAEPPEFVAVQSACLHAGCPLGYSASERLIECPCHASRYRAVADLSDPMSCAGQAVTLPARGVLPSWKVTRNGDRIAIDLKSRSSCSASFPPVENQVIRLDFARFSELMRPGGNVVGQPPGFADTLVVVRVSDTEAAALSAVCTHRGCTVAFDTGALACPCHGSRFGLDGAVQVGPATLPLHRYSATLEVDAIVVHV